jgi:2-C-methyl-D-erythritol 4-phosphate cytidylyltransferase
MVKGKVIKTYAIILAAGSGTRMDPQRKIPYPKVFFPLGDNTSSERIIQRTFRILKSCSLIDDFILVVGDDFTELAIELGFTKTNRVNLVIGGATRTESVKNALDFLADKANSTDLVLIHDGARCFITPELILKAIEGGLNFGAITLGLKSTNTLASVNSSGLILNFIDRNSVYQVQTPQVFTYEIIKKAHESKLTATDDASLVSLFCGVKIIEGCPQNIKITTPFDMSLARYLKGELT